jgi:hypothetical protein
MINLKDPAIAQQALEKIDLIEKALDKRVAALNALPELKDVPEIKALCGYYGKSGVAQGCRVVILLGKKKNPTNLCVLIWEPKKLLKRGRKVRNFVGEAMGTALTNLDKWIEEEKKR